MGRALFSLCASVRKMDSTWSARVSSLADVSKSGMLCTSAKHCARFVCTAWKKSPPFSENVLKKRCEIDFPESQTSSDRTSQVIMPVKNDSMLIGYEVFFDYWHGELSQLESVWNGVENESHLSQWTIAVGFVSDEDAWHPWRQPVVVALLQPARQRLRKSGETRKKMRKNIGIILRSW